MSAYDRSDLMAALPLSDGAKADLVRRMTSSDRHYHDMRHLDLLWERHRIYAPNSAMELRAFEPQIALAIAYHDAVYVGGGKDNEARSAALWLEVGAAESGLDETDRQWVADTIRATADHLRSAAALDMLVASDYARQWVLDLDLTPLGEAADVFDRNMQLLRAEDPSADLDAAIRHYGAAPALYRCPPLAQAFADAARKNLSRHLRHDVTVAVDSTNKRT